MAKSIAAAAAARLPNAIPAGTSAPLRTLPPILTVVVPTYNERQNLRELVSRLDAALDGINWEMVFVDDDSPDGTSALAKSLSRRDSRIRCLRRVGRRGLSGACIEGVLSSAAPYVAVIDGDLQHDETLLPKMLAELREDRCDIVVGSRFVEGGAADAGFSATRQAISKLGRRFAQAVLRTTVKDTMSGFFMLRREVVEDAAPQLCPEGFKILADILASSPESARVKELGYEFRQRHAGESKFDAKVALDFLGLIVSKLTRGVVPVSFVSFLLVGGVGVVLHLAALKLALLTGLTFFAAQTLATLVAMACNFVVNNLTTYRNARLRGWAWLRGLAMFCGICSLSALANIGVATWLFEHDQTWWAAGLAGIVMGATWNYAVSARLVWRK
ncbi:glycosyltransferase [Alsobacter sp. SYSU BS001988]